MRAARHSRFHRILGGRTARLWLLHPHRVLGSDTPSAEGACFCSNVGMNNSPRTAIVSALHDELASVLELMPD